MYTKVCGYCLHVIIYLKCVDDIAAYLDVHVCISFSHGKTGQF